jgi:hypothetical protein
MIWDRDLLGQGTVWDKNHWDMDLLGLGSFGTGIFWD